MSFMQKQFTGKQHWIKIDTSQGITFVPGYLVAVRDSDPITHPLGESIRERYKKALWQFTEGEPQSWENISGYGARLSAPGYMDCTEWTVFDTEDEARQYLNDTYDDDEPTPCTVCDGTGKVCDHCGDTEENCICDEYELISCADCDGTGKV